MEHCIQNDVKNKQIIVQGPESQEWEREKIRSWLVLSSCGPRTSG